MFTLDETVLRYTWNKEEGEVFGEDILSLAPRPLATLNERQRSVQCLCHHGKELLTELEKICTPSPLLALVKAQVEEDGCTCKTKTGSGDTHGGQFNMPREVFEREVWQLYTYFLNTFNTRLKNDVSFLSDLKKAICEMVEQCIITMDAHRYFFLQSIRSLLEKLAIEHT